VETALPSGALKEHGDQAGSARGRGTETRELREYRAHDELRAVHWKRTAALGRVVVREYERDVGQLLSLRLDNARPAAPDAAWSARFERQISSAAYLVEHALARGYAVEICTRDARSPQVSAHGAPDPLLRFLALLEPCREPQEFVPPSAGGRVIEVAGAQSSAGEHAA
jgi:uncharacterized protein (DUF58 family)